MAVVERCVFTVIRHEGVWAVENAGEFFGHSVDKEIAKAAANKRARIVQEGGQPCQVRVSGETGFYAV